MTERELEERRRPGVGQWVVASLLLHAVIVAALFLLPIGRWADSLRTQRTDPPPIEFDIVDDRGQLPPSLLGNVEPALPEDKKEAAKKEEEKKPEDDPDAKGQVVELPPPKEEKKPDKADFVSEYNMKVLKQTRARVRGPKAGSEAGAEAPRAPEKKSPAPPTPPSESRAEAPGSEAGQQRKTGTGGEGKDPGQAEKEQPQKKPQLLAMRTDVRRGTASESEVGLEPAGEAAGTGEAARKERGKHEAKERAASTQKGLLGQPAPPGHDGSVLPSFATSSRATGGGPDDYLKSIDEGDETALNSKQWRYASFFNRVKRQVAQKWHPDVVYRRFDPSGQVFGTKDRFTVVRVLLNRDGSLKNVALEKRSGVEFLDEEALSALRQAQPFVNPPNGLVDKQSGLISFKFGFFFEINSKGNLKLFKF